MSELAELRKQVDALWARAVEKGWVTLQDKDGNPYKVELSDTGESKGRSTARAFGDGEKTGWEVPSGAKFPAFSDKQAEDMALVFTPDNRLMIGPFARWQHMGLLEEGLSSKDKSNASPKIIYTTMRGSWSPETKRMTIYTTGHIDDKAGRKRIGALARRLISAGMDRATGVWWVHDNGESTLDPITTFKSMLCLEDLAEW